MRKSNPFLYPSRLMLIYSVCAFGLAIDLAEYALGNALSTYYYASNDPDDRGILRWLLSSVYLGAVAGASISGFLADKLGRRLIFNVCMIMIMLTSLGAFLSENPQTLVALRFASGIFLGAYPPAMSAYLAEVIPPERRGRTMMNIVALGATGPVIIMYTVRYLSQWDAMGIPAWKWGFLICSVLALACWLLLLRIPESPKWLRAVGRTNEAEKIENDSGLNPIVPDFMLNSKSEHYSADSRIVFFFFLTAAFIISFSTIGFPVIMGSILIDKGLTIQSTLLYLGTSGVGTIAGVIVAGAVIDKFERKTGLWFGAGCLILITVSFAVASSHTWLLTLATFYKIVVAMTLPILTIYAAESVPTLLRGRLTAWTWAVRGSGAALAPFVFVPALERFGTIGAAAVSVTTLVIFMLVLLRYASHNRTNTPLN
ncbi:MFS transporter [Brucella intermedia]|uniref:MFS transporter n=1 Tax=Brucella intermedia TaxID=94625 RepID=UPI00124C5CA8|nr:MFS transporter [Brucella intermedia]KAB2690370.1 MFS transporter [Brucella intermedia]